MNINTAMRVMNFVGPIFGVVVLWSIFSGNGPFFVAKIMISMTALALALFPPMIDFNLFSKPIVIDRNLNAVVVFSVVNTIGAALVFRF